MTFIDDAPSAQLEQDLLHSVKEALLLNRPILTHLNADTTWLLQVPYPQEVEHPPARSRFNILIDPWLKGPQSDVASWFSTQWHSIQSSVQDLATLGTYLQDIENLAHEARIESFSRSTKRDLPLHQPLSDESSGSSFVDAVVISHEFSDHCHKTTLLELPPTVPIFATTKAAELIRSWKHFQTVNVVPVFDGSDWHSSSIDPLPTWLGIARIVTPSNALYYHAAIAIFVANSDAPDAGAEAVIYTPHGIQATSIEPLATVSPPVQTLALLHGLHDVSITFTAQLNLGAHNALKAQRILHAKYWVGTHDEVKTGGGFIAPLLRRKVITLEDALKDEGGPDLEQVDFLNLSSGESQILL